MTANNAPHTEDAEDGAAPLDGPIISWRRRRRRTPQLTLREVHELAASVDQVDGARCVSPCVSQGDHICPDS